MRAVWDKGERVKGSGKRGVLGWVEWRDKRWKVEWLWGFVRERITHAHSCSCSLNVCCICGPWGRGSPLSPLPWHSPTCTHTVLADAQTQLTFFDILVILLKIRQPCNYALSHALTCTFTYKESVDFCPLVWCQSQSLSPLHFPISLPSSCFSLHSPLRSSWWKSW